MFWKKSKVKFKDKEEYKSNNKSLEKLRLQESLKENKDIIKNLIGDSNDVVFRNFNLAKSEENPALLIFIDGLTNTDLLNKHIINPLLNNLEIDDLAKSIDEETGLIQESIVTTHEIKAENKIEELIKSVLSGDAILLIEGFSQGFIVASKGWDARSVSEPTTESVIRGPRDGFTENLRTNTSHIRRRLRDPGLRIKGVLVGERSNTNIAIAYIEGLANKNIVKEVENRIKNIKVDCILESGYIEQFIEDSPFSPFPQLQHTERPDKAVGNLLEGRVVIIVDGTPFVLIAPAIFDQFYHSPEDYYQRFIITSLLRIVRIIGSGISLALPALYIALTAFHFEMLPTVFALSIAGGRAQVPFPSYLEAFFMEGVVEILREASVHLPNVIGSTIGIVGGLILGTAAVDAGLVSPAMVIVVALTTIGSFTSPTYSASNAIRILRFILMFLAATFGLYGFVAGIIAITIHMASLKSFGIPYLTPYAPSRLEDLKDSVIRFPLWKMNFRPKLMRTNNPKREDDSKEGGND
ncbi:spore germination protein [Orenia marismortui]|uniref:Spore germination protein KA/spore germination protein n=1 Tax=Orenia marismortui TaxID=46469 RepID=A0A4R8GYU4_9FIRM|nr:spore germination protein [Orenia marismortui]TDX51759.1 spore germination protein KA/spore germination protein [Orenia marismortui]